MAGKQVSENDKKERKLARQLGFHSGVRGQRELNNFRNRVSALPPSDPRYLPRAGYNDLGLLSVSRNADKRHLSPIKELVRKKKILVDTPDTKNHFSSKAFLDRYKEVIAALLAGQYTDYQKRMLRKEKRDLEQKMFAGDDAPPPAHVVANDKRRALRAAQIEAEKVAGPLREKEQARVARAQQKEYDRGRAKYKSNQEKRKQERQNKRRSRRKR